jgi:zinc transport system substrate-binding protein
MRRRVAAALFTLSLTAGCGSGAAGTDGAAGSGDGGKLGVVTAFYPLEFLSKRIGGDAVSVSNLTKAGAEPHDVELNPRQVGEISDAALVVHLKGFQPAVDGAVEQEAKDRAFDAGSVVELLPAEAEHTHEEEPGHADEPGPAAEGHDHEGEEPEAEHEEAAAGQDPHVWLDPVRFATIADKLGERLAAADPANAAGYRSRAAAVRTELTALDTEFATKLKTCERREIVTSHTAFNYLAKRYALAEIGITGMSPEAEPSPQRLAEVTREAREHGATTIFFETLVSPKVAETIAQEVGARTAVLDPLEGLTEPGADYFSVMRANLATLTTALECTS